jgi:hypothetical protein
MYINRHPRYVNQRGIDVQVKMYIDENNIAPTDTWGLPCPNAEAAYKSLAKYAKGVPKMNQDEVEDMNLAWSWTARHFGLYMSDARVISLEEAIPHLDMSTSTGCPFNQLYPKKKELFENDPDILVWLEDDWVRLGSDPDWTCIATNSLKEELRTKEKIGLNSIRTFTSMPVDATVHGTRLFVDMNEKMYESHLKTASAVGMSPYDGNWDVLYKKLNVFKNGYALDEKEYDSSLRAYMMWGCAQFRWKMLAEEYKTSVNLLRVRTYYRNLINTLILTPEGIVIQKKTGNPSGSCNTITDNTLILYTLLAYAWIRTSDNHDLCTYEAFEYLTSKALVGDDNTWTVDDEAHVFYNARSVIAVWKTLGITTTTDSLEARPAEELDFLSAKFLYMDGVMVPLYERDKILSSLMFSPKLKHTPCVTMERTAALLGIAWTDIQVRRFCRDIIKWLLDTYDEVLREDPHWIRAKTQIQTDGVYYTRFVGMRCMPQSLLGKQERLRKPNKKLLYMSDIYMSDNIANKIEKSENALSTALTKCNVSLAGQAYLDNVLDPFKDSQGRAPCLGKPGSGCVNVVVSTYTQTMNIVRPSSVPAGSLWDCHIINHQVNNLMQLNPVLVVSEAFHVTDQLSAPRLYGGVQAFTGPAGSYLGLAQGAGNLAVPQNYFIGQNNTRIIGKAFQTTNTTALLTVQGNCLMYNKTMNDPNDTIITINYTDAVVAVATRYGAASVYEQQSAFRTPADLIVMPKSKMHAAKLGSYQVSTETGVINDRGTDRSMGISVVDGSGTTYDSLPGWVPYAFAGSPHTPPTFTAVNSPFISPFNVSGTYYTGLSSDTTLVVTAIWVVETDPATTDTRIMSLAHPSPPLDNCAMEVYAYIAYHMPAGVSVKDNAAGDWIQTIASLAQQAGLPGAGILNMSGAMVNAVQKFYKSDFGKMTTPGNNPSAKQRKPQLKAAPKQQVASKGLERGYVRRAARPTNVVVVQNKKPARRKRAKSVDIIVRKSKR